MGHQHVQGTYASEQKICPRGTYRNSSACSRSAWPGPSTKARGPLAAAAAALLMLRWVGLQRARRCRKAACKPLPPATALEKNPRGAWRPRSLLADLLSDLV